MLTTSIIRDYRRFRSLGFCTVSALQDAKTLAEWREYENDNEDSTDPDEGCVRLRAEAETESYFDVYGEPDTEKERKEICRILDRDGCWYVIAEYLTPAGVWEHADSIGMIVDNSPCDPVSNVYCPDLMRSALCQMHEAWAEHEKTLCLVNEVASLA